MALFKPANRSRRANANLRLALLYPVLKNIRYFSSQVRLVKLERLGYLLINVNIIDHSENVHAKINQLILVIFLHVCSNVASSKVKVIWFYYLLLLPFFVIVIATVVCCCCLT